MFSFDVFVSFVRYSLHSYRQTLRLSRRYFFFIDIFHFLSAIIYLQLKSLRRNILIICCFLCVVRSESKFKIRIFRSEMKIYTFSNSFGIEQITHSLDMAQHWRSLSFFVCHLNTFVLRFLVVFGDNLFSFDVFESPHEAKLNGDSSNNSTRIFDFDTRKKRSESSTRQ